jgi:succinoglycan biosynthesis transport protein ExoP
LDKYSKETAETAPTSRSRYDPPSVAEYGAGEEDDFNLAGIFAMLWDNKWGILFSTALFTGLAAWSVSTETPIYTAAASVVLEAAEQNVTKFESVAPRLANDYFGMNTEILVLRSEDLMGRIVDAMALESDPEFNPFLRATLGLNKISAYDWIVQSVGLAAPPLPIEPTPQQARETAIGILRSKLRASIIEETYIFALTVNSEDPKKSANIANNFAELYVARRREVNYESTNQAMIWLTDRVVDLKSELEIAEAKVEDFATSATFIDEDALVANSRRLKSMRDRQAEQTHVAEELRARIARLKALRAESNFSSLGKALDNPQLMALAADLNATTPDAAWLVRFDSVFEDLLQKLNSDAKQAEIQAAAIINSISDIEAQVETQSADLVTLRQLRREAEASRLIYEYSLGRLKEISVQGGIQQADARVLSRASIPGAPSSPKVRATITKGGVVGLVAGILIIYLRNLLRMTIRTPEELETVTGLPVMGVIPAAPNKRLQGILEHILEKPASGLAEAVRNLRSAIQLSDLDRVPQVIMVTSSVPDEGKTSIAIALAQTSVMLGKRVLLIDCDLRRRSVRTQFKIETKAGIIAFLSGEKPLEEVITHDEKTSIDIIIADETQVTAIDIFASDRFGAFINEMRDCYDFIFIDSPPVLAVPDARVIAQKADFVVYIVRWNATKRRMIKSGLSLLDQVNVKVAGLVLNGINPKQMHRYGYYGYGYGYGTGKIERYYAN